jgi:vacuolar transporter chaperone complex subunit 4
MKFGNFLIQERQADWMLYYIDYTMLKTWLKRNVERVDARGDMSTVVAQFQPLVECELRKVNAFFLRTSDELKEKIDGFRRVLTADTLQSVQRNKHTRRGLKRQVLYLERLVQDLYYYSWLNEIGFKKILKKHDKMTGLAVSQWALLRVDEQSFVQSGPHFSQLLVQFSECCSKVRAMLTRRSSLSSPLVSRASPSSSSSSAPSPANNAQQAFQRETIKYWVERRDVMRVKTAIAKHLPVYVFGDAKQRCADAAQISSVYYDDDGLTLYEGRLKKSQGAIALRFRSYENASEVFVERKTHHESWVCASSVKERFSLEPSDVYDFIAGRYTEQDFEERLDAQDVRKPDARAAALKLFREIQYQVRDTRPTLTTAYKRTAFQLNGDARVRVSLDTELTMIRESRRLDDADALWRKPDYDVRASDVHHFPYAVLEVKLQTHEGVAAPEWITKLTEGPLCRMVHKFSKYCHGIAMLYPKQVPCFPPWIEWPDFSSYIENPSMLPKVPSTFNLSGSSGDDAAATGAANARKSSALPAPPSDSDSDSDNDDDVGGGGGGGDDLLLDIERLEQRRQRVRKRKRREREREQDASNNDGDSPPLSFDKCWRMLKPKENEFDGRPIIERVKVEPKTYFALERTYLRWMSLSIMLESIGIALLSFSSSDGETALAFSSGVTFVIVATVFMAYALFMYRWRAHMIKTQSDARFDDLWGPVALFVALVAATILNLVLNFASETTKSVVH